MRPILLISLALLVAGCTSPGDPEGAGDAAPPAGDGLPTPATIWTDCDQWHLHFDARAEDFDAEAPPGYTVTADENGLTTLLIHVTLCANVQEAYVAVPVTAPPAHDDPDRSEVATIQVFHAGHGASTYPQPFHGRLIEATFDLTETPAGPSLSVTGGQETFTVTNILNPSSGAFAGEHWARLAHDNDKYGILNADGNESTSVGFGAAVYTHEGPGGAPPATAGITHIVTGLDIHMTTETRT